MAGARNACSGVNICSLAEPYVHTKIVGGQAAMSIPGPPVMYKCSRFRQSVHCAKVVVAKLIKVGPARPDEAKEGP